MRQSLNRQREQGRGHAAWATMLVMPVLACGVLLGSAPAAGAGVVVDPNGPASKQYSADLDRARQQGTGSGGSAGVPGSRAKAPLFGQGITRKDARGATGGSGSGGSGSNGSSSPVAASTGPDGNSTNTVEIAAISLAVILCGGLIAFAVRRGGLGRPT
jgi:hypothetical protein